MMRIGRCPILPASLPTWGARRPTATGPGATPKPAWSTDHPHTWVRKRIEPKNSAANAVPNTNMARFAHLKLAMRNRSRSSAGALVCRWWATKTASTTSPAPRTPRVRALSHPNSSEPTTP